MNYLHPQEYGSDHVMIYATLWLRSRRENREYRRSRTESALKDVKDPSGQDRVIESILKKVPPPERAIPWKYRGWISEKTCRLFNRRNEVKRRMKHGTERKRMLSRLKERIRVNIGWDRQKRVEKYGQESKDI